MRQRLDIALVERGLITSREKSQRAILAGQVRVNGHTAKKASDPVRAADAIELLAPERFVSRGGLKLDHALESFALGVNGLAAADLGASTGGFTDCLLQRGAARVFAVDVGHGQLDWKLRNDPRVAVLEKTNARALTAESLPPVDLVVVDCSFISLRKILPAAAAILKPGGHIVALVKPQFEAGKSEADKGAGVITDPAIHARVLAELETFTNGVPGLGWRRVVESPIVGPAGNREFLALIEKAP